MGMTEVRTRHPRYRPQPPGSDQVPSHSQFLGHSRRLGLHFPWENLGILGSCASEWKVGGPPDFAVMYLFSIVSESMRFSSNSNTK